VHNWIKVDKLNFVVFILQNKLGLAFTKLSHAKYKCLDILLRVTKHVKKLILFSKLTIEPSLTGIWTCPKWSGEC